MDGRHIAACATIAVLVAAGAGGAAHAVQEGELIPAWIKTVFTFYADGQITDGELIAAFEYLIAQGIIQVAPAAEQSPLKSAVQAADDDAAIKAAELSKAADDAIIKAAELSKAADDARAEAERAEESVGKATSPSAIRQNEDRAADAADNADKAARAADKAITAAADAARAAADAARAADTNTVIADNGARMTAATRTAVDTLASINDIRSEVKDHAGHLQIFKTHAPATNRELVEAISEVADDLADGANMAYGMAISNANAVIDDTNAAEAARADGIDPYSPDGIDVDLGIGTTIRTLDSEAERAAEAAAHYIDASTALVGLADAAVDEDIWISAITNVVVSIDKGDGILNDMTDGMRH